jgi:hypothetical protein
MFGRLGFVAVVAVAVSAGAIVGCGGGGVGAVGVAEAGAVGVAQDVGRVGVALPTHPERIAIPLAVGDGGEGSGGIVLVDPTGRQMVDVYAYYRCSPFVSDLRDAGERKQCASRDRRAL